MSNARLKQLVKGNNIKTQKVPPALKPTLLSAKEDPGLPETTFTEPRDRDTLAEITVGLYSHRNRKKQ